MACSPPLGATTNSLSLTAHRPAANKQHNVLFTKGWCIAKCHTCHQQRVSGGDYAGDQTARNRSECKKLTGGCVLAHVRRYHTQEESLQIYHRDDPGFPKGRSVTISPKNTCKKTVTLLHYVCNELEPFHINKFSTSSCKVSCICWNWEYDLLFSSLRSGRRVRLTLSEYGNESPDLACNESQWLSRALVISCALVIMQRQVDAVMPDAELQHESLEDIGNLSRF